MPIARGYVFKPLEQRFWAKVEKTEGCWLWTGMVRRGAGGDYGRIFDNRVRRQRPAAQIAWELHHGEPFPDGMDACHHCDNPRCVRPDHIFVGTAKDNARDALAKGRLRSWRADLTHCKRDHPFAGDNLAFARDGSRVCRACARMRAQRACVECGEITKAGPRCRSCYLKAKATSVREDELHCFRCNEWKPDDAFARNRSASPPRRGRHSSCRSCSNKFRRRPRA